MLQTLHRDLDFVPLSAWDERAEETALQCAAGVRDLVVVLVTSDPDAAILAANWWRRRFDEDPDEPTAPRRDLVMLQQEPKGVQAWVDWVRRRLKDVPDGTVHVVFAPEDRRWYQRLRESWSSRLETELRALDPERVRIEARPR